MPNRSIRWGRTFTIVSIQYILICAIMEMPKNTFFHLEQILSWDNQFPSTENVSAPTPNNQILLCLKRIFCDFHRTLNKSDFRFYRPFHSLNSYAMFQFNGRFLMKCRFCTFAHTNHNSYHFIFHIGFRCDIFGANIWNKPKWWWFKMLKLKK